MSSKRVLVTGSAGTLGRSAVHELRRWHEVQGFDRVPSPDLKDAFVGNLTDAEAVEETCAWQDSGAVRRWNHPADYPWSSYRQKVGAEKDHWIDRDPCYLDLSAHEQVRKERYQRYINQGLPEDEKQLITQALQRGQLTGTERFVEEVEKRLGLRIEHRGQGRPRKTREDNTEIRGA